jgi:Family of unknown function (DUF6527)
VRQQQIRPEFVDVIPDELTDGVVYVSMRYATAVHRCCCGCGRETATPLSPTDWKLSFDGVSISLHPSIGNWGYPCESHYWIRDNRVVWAPKLSRAKITAGRVADRARKNDYFGTVETGEITQHDGERTRFVSRARSLLKRLRR